MQVACSEAACTSPESAYVPGVSNDWQAETWKVSEETGVVVCVGAVVGCVGPPPHRVLRTTNTTLLMRRREVRISPFRTVKFNVALRNPTHGNPSIFVYATRVRQRPTRVATPTHPFSFWRQSPLGRSLAELEPWHTLSRVKAYRAVGEAAIRRLCASLPVSGTSDSTMYGLTCCSVHCTDIPRWAPCVSSWGTGAARSAVPGAVDALTGCTDSIGS